MDKATLAAAISVAENVYRIDPRLPPIFTLRHLSVLSDTSYIFLRQIVARKGDDYKEVQFRKRVPGRKRHRTIHIPGPDLMQAQRWIAHNILRWTRPHSASYAYHPDCHPIYAAKEHKNAKWLLKIDVADFFDTITEKMVFNVFLSLGYSRLVAFELARITTRQRDATPLVSASKTGNWTAIPEYRTSMQGFLPQGAPSSPMLSNLVMRDFDELISHLSSKRGFRYTRYADDLAFSTEDDTRAAAFQLKQEAISLLASYGFAHNALKTVVRGPGARRLVLGIHVDGPKLRLSKEFKDQIRLHLHYLSHPMYGAAKHAKARKTSVSSIYHHVRGLIAWAQQVEPPFGAESLAVFDAVAWPPIRKQNTFNRATQAGK